MTTYRISISRLGWLMPLFVWRWLCLRSTHGECYVPTLLEAAGTAAWSGEQHTESAEAIAALRADFGPLLTIEDLGYDESGEVPF